MCYLRFPGRVLGEREKPRAPLLHLLAMQLGISAAAWDLYAQRDETRREHLRELFTRMGLDQFGKAHYRELTRWLEPVALQTTRSVVLAQSLIEELRNRRVVLPSVAVIERICAAAATRAQRKVFAHLTEGLSAEQRIKLSSSINFWFCVTVARTASFLGYACRLGLQRPERFWDILGVCRQFSDRRRCIS
jgi:Domain of unknown function (DUF4158)